MMYKAICVFRDLQDGHLYNADEPFPHDGREISPGRLEDLLTGKNAAKRPLIVKTVEFTEPDAKTPQKPKKRTKTKE